MTLTGQATNPVAQIVKDKAYAIEAFFIGQFKIKSVGQTVNRTKDETEQVH